MSFMELSLFMNCFNIFVNLTFVIIYLYVSLLGEIS